MRTSRWPCTIARTITVFDSILLPPTAPTRCCCWATGLKFSRHGPPTAAARHIPIAHISGGDVTLGRGGRDATAHLHLQNGGGDISLSCADSAARLVRMGEAPDTVFCVGGLGDENIRTLPKMSREELCNSTGLAAACSPFALVTYHPETARRRRVARRAECKRCAAAIGKPWPACYWLITGSNARRRRAGLHRPRHAARSPRRTPGPRRASCKAWACGGTSRPWSAPRWWRGTRPRAWWRRRPLRCPPSTSARAAGRARWSAPTYSCCAADAAGHRGRAAPSASPPSFAAGGGTRRQSPYGGGDTSGKICTVLQNFDFSKPKIFYDGPVPEFDPQRSVLV